MIIPDRLRSVRIVYRQDSCYGTQVFDAQTGSRLAGVRSVELKTYAGKVQTAVVEFILPTVEIDSSAVGKTEYQASGLDEVIQKIIATLDDCKV